MNASRTVSTLVLVGSALVCVDARAQSSASQQAVAQSLFEQARTLYDQRKYAEACPKFAESQRLDPAGGTLVNLALCFEAEGRIASAWALFDEALVQARKDARPEREKLCRDHIAVLEPKLPRLTFVVPTPAPAGLEIKLDSDALGAATWGVPVPVDPGDHVIRASAPGKQPQEQHFSVAVGRRQTLEIPVLAEAPQPAVGASASPGTSPSPTAPAAATAGLGAPPASGTAAPPEGEGRGAAGDHGNAKRTIGFVVGGAGIVALAIGSYFGVSAISKANDGDKNAFDSAAWGANIGIGLGVAGLAVGTYLALTSSPSANASSGAARRAALATNPARTDISFSPAVAQHGVGVSLQGRFW